MIPVQNTVPIRFTPIVTWWLIGINCAVFFVQISLGPGELERFIYSFALIPARDIAPTPGLDAALSQFLPFLSNTFLHAGWLHLILNMWTLWLFGPTVEDRLGRGRFLLFYLASGVLASLAHAVFNPNSTIPALGASGAISGVLGCYVGMFPFARLVVLVPILFFPFFFDMPAVIFAGLWFFIQLLQGTVDLFLPALSGGVAWWAHIGGFVAGLVLGPLLHQPSRTYRPYEADEGVFGFAAAGDRRNARRRKDTAWH